MILMRCFSTGLAVVLLTASGLAWARKQPPLRTTTPAQAQPHHVPLAKQAQSAQPAQPAPAALGGAEPSLLGHYGNWGAYAASPGGRKVCFAIAKPIASRTYPADLLRSRAYFFVSSRPRDGVKDEVSIIFGFMPATEVTAEIGPAKFAMYPRSDVAWIKHLADQARLVDAMRKGSDLVVKAVFGPGTQTTDTFSLRGLEQALERTAHECEVPMASTPLDPAQPLLARPRLAIFSLIGK